jgi:hypothetical protein
LRRGVQLADDQFALVLSTCPSALSDRNSGQVSAACRARPAAKRVERRARDLEAFVDRDGHARDIAVPVFDTLDMNQRVERSCRVGEERDPCGQVTPRGGSRADTSSIRAVMAAISPAAAAF